MPFRDATKSPSPVSFIAPGNSCRDYLSLLPITARGVRRRPCARPDPSMPLIIAFRVFRVCARRGEVNRSGW